LRFEASEIRVDRVPAFAGEYEIADSAAKPELNVDTA